MDTPRRRPKGRWAGNFRARAAAALCGVALAAGTTACSSASDSGPIETTTRPSTLATGAVVALPGSLAADFAELRPALGGRVGLAIAAVGGDQISEMGDWTGGPAWSTMKVPLTLAVLRANGNTSTYQMSAAITESDNYAAEVLWQALGTPDVAAHAVESVLREGGDGATKVPASRVRPDYSSFGQADWSLSDQVRFASRLPCLPEADSVTELMSRVVWGQQWGLGRLDNAEFKGGWGPDADGNYLVRQFGVVKAPNGQVAIALAAQASSGAFAEGTQILDKLAALVDEHLGELPTGHCR
ncbi:class A beta-lactamase-related serine hydrolase [Nocardia sp. CDC159]|uniref:Class A beta-lactamase-related serine hydrolase n=1 Tax=Nocardia pulmonis TaxID=2951408 RepID=A0A9X2EA82_9NOCA|nr:MULTISPECIES: class A beta-lactamase-related serine hydrolase [Nocardia]MCM6776556.1 class A beta-lactamase-related serine hydrolase [Nocardia pulmonis]MCM6788980.1 class A beta-lactamase-related serine hydrolase [Nocardia sp. CDC159]